MGGSKPLDEQQVKARKLCQIDEAYQSWGRNPKIKHAEVLQPNWCNEIDLKLKSRADYILPYGYGRSYGDCGLNHNNALILTRNLRRIIAFDRESGVLEAEAGISLEEILGVVVSSGWFLPVSPGTKFVTLGGAIANDIHGKNQTKDGTFGRYVLSLKLLRSNGELISCSATENSDLFSATIAGLGLTGLIVSARVQLKPISGPYIDKETIPFYGLDQFFKITEESDKGFLYTVAWLDCLGRDKNFARGIFFRGNHANKKFSEAECKPRSVLFSVPFDCPEFTLNNLTLKKFNALFFAKNSWKQGKSVEHYDPFFYPLDSVGNWNRVYGPRGFFQFQCVVPRDVIVNILSTIVESRQPSFLGVLKCFGDLTSPGMLSFPRSGITLVLDFPNKGIATFHLLRKLHEIVLTANGAIYPAKDTWMTPSEFKSFYPRWKHFQKFIDPAFSSSFWRRVAR
jgi:FAD/FMN-containing dehydrogenase